MHVLCPSCAAEYEIPELQRPRKLRCARCASEWRVAPSANAEPPPPAVNADDQPGAAREDPEPEPDPTRPLDGPFASLLPGPAIVAASGAALATWMVLWVLSLMLIAAGLVSLWHWRLPIVHAWPPALRLLPAAMRPAATLR